MDSRSAYRQPRLSSLAALVVLATGLTSNIACADDLNPHDLALLDRLTFGASTTSAAHMHSMGVERWIQEQLHPAGNPALPDAAKAQIEAMPDVHSFPFDIAVAFEQQSKSANQVADPEQKRRPSRSISRR